MDIYKDELSEFISNHPLRVFCPKTSWQILIPMAIGLAHSGLTFARTEGEVSYSPESLEERIESSGIEITESTAENFPSGSSPSWTFFAWSDPDKQMLSLNTAAIRKLLSLKTCPKLPRGITPQTVHALFLAHEWFHLFIERIEKPLEWIELSESERIIVEEMSARIFSVLILGVPHSPLFLDRLLIQSFPS